MVPKTVIMHPVTIQGEKDVFEPSSTIPCKQVGWGEFLQEYAEYPLARTVKVPGAAEPQRITTYKRGRVGLPHLMEICDYAD